MPRPQQKAGSRRRTRVAGAGRVVADLTRKRLRDRVCPDLDVLFVGINPGIRSAETGHHFAGWSNRFWKVLHASGLVDEPLTHRDDDRLPSFGLGITNLVARPTRGIDELRPEEYVAGASTLARKVRVLRPRVVALVGLTLAGWVLGRARSGRAPGLQPERIEGVPVFVLPNPSGRNAHFGYDAMVRAFAALEAWRRAQQDGVTPRP